MRHLKSLCYFCRNWQLRRPKCRTEENSCFHAGVWSQCRQCDGQNPQELSQVPILSEMVVLWYMANGFHVAENLTKNLLQNVLLLHNKTGNGRASETVWANPSFDFLVRQTEVSVAWVALDYFDTFSSTMHWSGWPRRSPRSWFLVWVEGLCLNIWCRENHYINLIATSSSNSRSVTY